jgi:hypothetical protein
LAQTPDHVERELAAGQHVHGDPDCPQARIKLSHPIGDLAWIGDVQGMDVGVATIVRVPSATASWASSRLCSIDGGPSSTPGSK